MRQEGKDHDDADDTMAQERIGNDLRLTLTANATSGLGRLLSYATMFL